MSAATWCGPSSFSTSFIAAKIGRSGQPMQKPGGRGGTDFDRSGKAKASGWFGSRSRSLKSSGAFALRKSRTAESITAPVYSPPIGKGSLP